MTLLKYEGISNQIYAYIFKSYYEICQNVRNDLFGCNTKNLDKYLFIIGQETNNILCNEKLNYCEFENNKCIKIMKIKVVISEQFYNKLFLIEKP